MAKVHVMDHPVDRAQNQLYPQRGSWNERISRDDRRDCTVDVL